MTTGQEQFLLRARNLRAAAAGTTDPLIHKLLLQLAVDFEQEARRTDWRRPGVPEQVATPFAGEVSDPSPRKTA